MRNKRMNLRSTPPLRRPPARRLALLAGAALAALVFGGASDNAAAGTSDYPSTLYLSSVAASPSLLSAGETLVTSGASAPPSTAPTLALGSACTSCLSGSYSYEYTVVDGTGGESPPSPASTNLSATNMQIVVSGLPTGVTWRLYRKIPASGVYKRVAQSSGATWTDSLPDASATPVLPQSQTRPVSFSGTGYYEFAPGAALATSSVTSPTVGSPAFDGKGWVVNASGGVNLAAGTWTFTNNVKAQAGNGTAHLVIGMWKVNDSGTAVGSAIIDPTTAGENTSVNIATFSGQVTTTINNVAAISLAANEHLYVQFWRRQTVASSGTPITTLFVYDGVSKIAVPPFPNAPTLSSPADAVRVNTTPQLSATFSDPDGTDTGTLAFQLCSDNACNTVVQSGSSSSGLANNASGNWTPTSLGDGTYYWRAQATDSAGNLSQSWSTIRSFVVDTTRPSTAALVSPAAGARVNSTQVSATFSDPDGSGDTGTLNFQLCSNSSCSSVVASGSSASGIANGANGSWTPTGVADGTYYWRAQAQDAAGNQSLAWSATRSFVLDTTAPSAPALGSVGSLVKAIPALSANFSDPDGAVDSGTLTFQLCSDSACSTVVQQGSPSGGPTANNAWGTWTPSAPLADGTYWWRAGAQDVAGNGPTWSTVAAPFTLDMIAPDTPTLGTVAARTATTPTLSANFSDQDAGDTGTITLQLCSTSSCSTVLQSATSPSTANNTTWSWTPTHLADGTYYWRAQAQDAATNQSAWATSSFVVDTTAPNLPTLVSPAGSARVNATQLSATFTDPDGSADSGTLDIQLCSDSACATVVASTTSATVASGGTTSWTPTGVADGTYYWRARATDAAGNQSAWGAARSFTLDTVAPGTPSLSGPADGADLPAAPALSATFADTDAGDSGTLDFQICADSACSSVVLSGTSTSGIAGGSTGSWSPSGLAGGTYYWRASAVDAAGNQSSWSTTRSFTFDKTPPVAPTLGRVPSRINAMPSLWATFSDPDAGDTGSILVQVCGDSACTKVLQSASSPSGVSNGGDWTWVPSLGDGSYFWRANATDAAGNQSSWSAVAGFVIDRRAPVVTPVVPAQTRVNTPPLLSARADDANDSTDRAQVFFDLCADEACTQILATGASGLVPAGSVASWQPPGPLNDGTYYWRVLAADIIGNQSSWSSSQSFVVDTTPPSVPDLAAPDEAALVNKVLLTGSDPGKAGRLQFEVCADAGCDTVVASGSSPSVAAGEPASWTGGGLPDGTYFWRANAVDEAGNSSEWSATQAFTLDTTPPAKPRALTATVSGTVLSLAWRPPAGGTAPVGYYLIINGRRSKLLPAKTRVVKITLQRHDLRTFAIAAVDKAGNVGAPTVVVSKDVLRRSLKEAVPVRAAKRPRH
jgi:hypothetical protein